MNFKVNDKINQVTEKTLVVGMDIAKETHYASFVDERGRALAKVTPIKQSHAGFEYLYAQIRTLLRETGKTEVIVGIEPTGHYWMNLAYYLADLGISLVMVNPLHVKRSKELDDNLQTKNDKKDSLVIARLIKDGRFSYPRILRDVDAELRVGSTHRANLTEELGAIKNRLIRWLDRYFPEFRQVFPSFGKMALAVLECTPFPSEVVGKSSEELLSLYREVDGLKSPQLPKTKKLMVVAASSIGITEGTAMARFELATLLRNYYQVEADLESVTSELTALIQSSVEYEILSSVPGMGDATIVDLLAEIGSFSNYQDARQLLKLAGLTLRENSSGKMQGQKRISKRGRRKLRALLFRVMMPILRFNDAFRALHEYYTTRTNNPLRKKQSIVLLCGKLLKILHSICMKQVKFDGTKMKADISCLQEAA